MRTLAASCVVTALFLASACGSDPTADPGPGAGGTNTDAGTTDAGGDSDTDADLDAGTPPDGADEAECDSAREDCSVWGKIDAVFLAQTHVLQPDDELFTLVGDREALIKVHVVSPTQPKSPVVTAQLNLHGDAHTLTLTGPSMLPASVPIAQGLQNHTYEDSFTAVIPRQWVQPGLSIAVKAAYDSRTIDDLKIGAPTRVIMTMFDVHYFSPANGDYPPGWQEELEAKWPVAELEVRRIPNVVFPELVIPPRAELRAARVTSKDDYLAQTGQNFDGEQAAALEWKSALKAAAGTGGRFSLYFVNIYGANAGGQAGGFGGVGNGTSAGILHHELGHALSLPHWGGSADYPYRGEMYGIPAPNGNDPDMVHVGPTWGFYLPDRYFIPCTVQTNAVGGEQGAYKKDPMQGGGQGDQEQGYLLRHFSDYSVNKMRNYLEGHVLIWNDALNSYASWDAETGDYTKTVTNNGVSYPVERNVEVISVMAAISAANTDVNLVYPPIGPYVAGLIDVFDPSVAADRTRAAQVFCPNGGCDLSLRVVQGGVQKLVMLAAAWDPSADPLAGASLLTRAVNLPAGDGEVTRAELLLTPDAQTDGLQANPTVLATWIK